MYMYVWGGADENGDDDDGDDAKDDDYGYALLFFCVPPLAQNRHDIFLYKL